MQKNFSGLSGLGIGTGILLYIAMSVLPNIYLVHNGQTEKEAFVEISMQPTETMLNSLPLLLFSGVSIAIIFTLLHRAFSVEDVRLKSRWFSDFRRSGTSFRAMAAVTFINLE